MLIGQPTEQVLAILYAHRFERTVTAGAFPSVRNPDGSWAKRCVWCGGPLAGRRRRICSDACNGEYLYRINWNHVRYDMEKRASFRCESCRMDMLIEQNRWLAMDPSWRPGRYMDLPSPDWTDYRWRKLEPKAHIHHVLPVRKGGGCCGPENLQYLCVDCHKLKASSHRKEPYQ